MSPPAKTKTRQRARHWHELIELWKLLIYVVCSVEPEQETALLSTYHKSEDRSGFADLFIRLFFQDTLALEMFYPRRVGVVVASGLLGTREQLRGRLHPAFSRLGHVVSSKVDMIVWNYPIKAELQLETAFIMDYSGHHFLH